MALFQLIQHTEAYPYRPIEGVTLYYRRFDAHGLAEIAETIQEQFSERVRTRTGAWESRIPPEKLSAYNRAIREALLDRAIVRWDGIGHDPANLEMAAPCTREWKCALPGAWIDAVLELARGGGDVDPTRASGPPSNGN